MSREIKFRLWHEGSKTMIYLPDMAICDEYSHLCFNAVDEEYRGIGRLPGNDWMNDISLYEVQQYTGSKGKNGKEIYEGDIIREDNAYTSFSSGLKVLFEQELLQFGVVEIDNYFTPLSDIKGYWEVIGNIYENPELLK